MFIEMAASFDVCLDVAKKELGFTGRIKDRQLEALRLLFAGNDVVCVLPTGYGKSLIYQLLPIMMAKKCGMDCLPIIIIVSPLNSIMQDQVMALGKMGLKACFLDIEGGGATTCQININRNEDREPGEEDLKTDVIFSNVPIEKVREGNYCFLYAHPETLVDNKEIGKMLRGRVMQKLVCAIAVDEVHMISEWGKDFRRSFARLGQLTSLFPNVPHLALTATATTADLKCLSSTLEFRDTHYLVENPDRPNIYLEKRERLPNIKKFEKYDEILNEIGSEIFEKLHVYPVTIVYCDSLESVGYSYMYIAHLLGDKGYTPNEAPTPENRIFAQYHKDYTVKMKCHIIYELTQPNPKIRLVFATVALGMGLNAPSVCRIIHFRPPTTLEKYLQEIGRAGRIGQRATAIMYYNNNDIAPNRKGLDRTVRDFALNTSSCLRKHLLRYFGFEESVFHGSPDLCCSNCLKNN